MGRSGDIRQRSAARLLVTYGAITLIPVLLLGFVLANSYRAEVDRRGLAEGRSEALLIAQTAVQPLLNGRPLSQGLSQDETDGLRRLVADSVRNRDVLRLRLRNLAGQVVFSDDGSGFGKTDEDDDALSAAHGIVVAHLTHLNTDSVDAGNPGPEAVEIYQPLQAGSPLRRVGVLELYLPYAPISADVTAGLHTLYRNLAIGLAALYLALFAISVSVSRRLRRQVKLNAYLAEHDPLTDLPNRTLFHRRVEGELVRGKLKGQPTTIAIIDLDRFKEVNDTLGHHNGDRLLAALSQRLAAHLRGLDAVARLGGDEFGIVISGITEPDDFLRRIRDVIEHEVNISGLPLSVEASIGFVVAPTDGNDVDELLQMADVAMYEAKRQHAGVVRYEKTQSHYDASNLALVAELRHAIEADQLVLHYQPKARLYDHRIEAVEALVRWQHPEYGLLYPDRFVPLAEQTDLIDKLTEWVVANALKDLISFGSANDHLTVAVNVSARNLGRPAFASQVLAALEKAGVPPRRLIVEVTETALMSDPSRATAVLGELSAAGVRVSLDDFGQGQTSLGYLSTLPIYELKIDKMFVTDMTDNPAHAAIVRSVVDLGHNLAFRVVGEGVETQVVLDGLADAGCDLAQGYLFARPMPADALAGWLRHFGEELLAPNSLTRRSGLGDSDELKEIGSDLAVVTQP
jgi:diguanylate cyclase (GGDEF)-like protein